MPYTVTSSNLPANVRKLSSADQKRWIGAWNGAYDDCVNDGKGADACEVAAFRIANAAVSKTSAEEDAAGPTSDPLDFGDGGDGGGDGGDGGEGDGSGGNAPDARPSAAYFRKLWELFRSGKSWQEAMKAARGHAGGVAPRKRKPAAAGEPDTFYDGMYDAPVAVGGSDKDYSVWTVKYEKSDDRINYREASDVGVQCVTCENYLGHLCRIVEGRIDPSDVCDMHIMRANLYAEQGDTDAPSRADVDALIDLAAEEAKVTLTTADRAAARQALANPKATVESWVDVGVPAGTVHEYLPIYRQEFATGNVQRLIATFGKWAGGDHDTCTRKLAGKVRDPDRLCAWLKDRAKGNPYWRGKSDAKGAVEMWEPEPVVALAEPVPLRLFMELPARQEYAAGTVPEWVPLLPKPGTYTHPSYGKVKLTKDRIGRFIQNLKERIYQEHIPVDAEHQLKTSGALGWITEVRENADGGADARVDWNDRGRSLMSDDRYRYVSPEWWDEWNAPDTNKKYRDVLIGLALTTRPFFKDGSLRSLVANEAGLHIAAAEASGPDGTPVLVFHQLTPEPEGPGPESMEGSMPEEIQTPAPATEPVTAPASEPVAARTEPQPETTQAAEVVSPAQFAELQRQFTELQTRNTRLEQEARRKRFTEIATGRGGGSDGRHAWVGDVPAKVTFMEKLADSFGEESDEVKAYIQDQNTTARQLRESDLFKSYGSPLNGDTQSAEARAVAMAEKLHQEDRERFPTLEMAEAHVWETNRDLYEQAEANRERRGGSID